MRESDVVGRLGGDEFAIVAEDIDAPEDAMQLARRVCTALGKSYRCNGHEVTSSASIGIALGPIDGEPVETLMKNADLALYRAKEDGHNTFRFFEPAMDAALQKRRRLETAALLKNQLYIDYQPQFDLESGRLTGYEALVRWWHPSDGEIPPSVILLTGKRVRYKIDRSFIDTLSTSPQTSAIVSSIVGLGRSLKVTITAEGVENEGQAAMLREWGCDQVQGFCYGKPATEVHEEETSRAIDRPLVA